MRDRRVGPNTFLDGPDTMSLSLPIGYAAARTVAAIILAGRARAQGAEAGQLLAQGVSDASLALGIVAYGDARLAEHLDGALALLVVYAFIWEGYRGLIRLQERFDDDAPGADLSAASLGRPIFGVWEAFAVIPAWLMAGFAVDQATGGGAYLFRSNALDALTAAALGGGVLIWVRRRRPSSQELRWLLRGLGILLLVTALWVWL